MAVTTGNIIHQLAAKSVIREWQEGSYSSSVVEHEFLQNQLKSTIIDLSLQENIISPFTSFVGVEERLSDEDLITVSTLSLDHLAQSLAPAYDELQSSPWDKVTILSNRKPSFIHFISNKIFFTLFSIGQYFTFSILSNEVNCFKILIFFYIQKKLHMRR